MSGVDVCMDVGEVDEVVHTMWDSNCELAMGLEVSC
jgi:hypothetical protein